MPGYSKDLIDRYTKTWGKPMTGNGPGNLANKRHSTVIQQPTEKSKKRKSKSKDCRTKKSRKY